MTEVLPPIINLERYASKRNPKPPKELNLNSISIISTKSRHESMLSTNSDRHGSMLSTDSNGQISRGILSYYSDVSDDCNLNDSKDKFRHLSDESGRTHESYITVVESSDDDTNSKSSLYSELSDSLSEYDRTSNRKNSIITNSSFTLPPICHCDIHKCGKSGKRPKMEKILKILKEGKYCKNLQYISQLLRQSIISNTIKVNKSHVAGYVYKGRKYNHCYYKGIISNKRLKGAQFRIVKKNKGQKNLTLVLKPLKNLIEIKPKKYPVMANYIAISRENSKIYQRNLASYLLARFLGCSKLIPRCYLVDYNNKKYLGTTFIENGTQLHHIPKSKLKNLYKDHKILQQLFTKQLVDYLTGNVDSNPTNILINDRGKVFSIDYDLSWGKDYSFQKNIHRIHSQAHFFKGIPPFIDYHLRDKLKSEKFSFFLQLVGDLIGKEETLQALCGYRKVINLIGKDIKIIYNWKLVFKEVSIWKEKRLKENSYLYGFVK